MKILYLHGFASGPSSGKATFFAARLREQGCDVDVPDLAEGAFERLTITSQLLVIERAAGSGPVSLIGSSLGGYLAALYASRSAAVERVVLLAPAFEALHRWPSELGPETMSQWRLTGKRSFFHYAEGGERELHYAFIEDLKNYDAAPSFSQPGLIFHGLRDETVSAQYSVEYARVHPNVRLRLLDSDHQLTDAVETIWEEAREFLLAS